MVITAGCTVTAGLAVCAVRTGPTICAALRPMTPSRIDKHHPYPIVRSQGEGRHRTAAPHRGAGDARPTHRRPWPVRCWADLIGSVAILIRVAHKGTLHHQPGRTHRRDGGHIWHHHIGPHPRKVGGDGLIRVKRQRTGIGMTSAGPGPVLEQPAGGRGSSQHHCHTRRIVLCTVSWTGNARADDGALASNRHGEGDRHWDRAKDGSYCSRPVYRHDTRLALASAGSLPCMQLLAGCWCRGERHHAPRMS